MQSYKVTNYLQQAENADEIKKEWIEGYRQMGYQWDATGQYLEKLDEDGSLVTIHFD